MTDKEQEDFECWARKQGLDLEYRNFPDIGKFYESPRTIWSFEAWQASRESLVIELPDDGIEDCQKAWGTERCKDTFDCGYNFASLRHEQAIEASGLKVQP